jgi:hypothetical protein
MAVVDLPEAVASALQTHTMNGAARQENSARSFTEMLQHQYASGLTFRDAVAARIALESGSGRTRAETNAPNDTSAGGSGTTPKAPV